MFAIAVLTIVYVSSAHHVSSAHPPLHTKVTAQHTLVVYTVLNGWADTTCLSSLSTHLVPTPLFSGVLLSPNPGLLIRTLL